ncbi:MAG TPA: BamA/TamA family outer membrane protein [Cyclobacteriaceae bacterium]|jgi:hypothetical protein|nr:BamA/TamA family outer membrane protein [Cyclobacteriaceae bacterium]
MKKVSRAIILLLLLSQLNGFAQLKTKKIILVTLDGFRWQELFQGADSSILFNKRYVQDQHVINNFWGSSETERRQKLLPFFWNVIGSQGQLYGNRAYHNNVNCTNPYWFSCPGYSEMLVGFVDHAVNSNDNIQNPNQTVLDFINQQTEFTNKVAVFSTWETVSHIASHNPGTFYVNAGHEPVHDIDSTLTESMLNSWQGYSPDSHRVRNDFFTFYYALEYIQKRKPDVMYISFEETDRYAHNGQYDEYLKAANATDFRLKMLWDWIQSQTDYKDQTTLIITTDHGRGRSGRHSWTTHGRQVIGSDQIWLAVLGPDTQSTGEITTVNQLFQNQIAATVSSFLGLPYINTKPVGNAITSTMLASADSTLMNNTKHKDSGIVFLPAVIRSPETKWGFGAASSVTFKLRSSDSQTRTSSVQALGLYTTRKQSILGLESTVYFPREDLIFRLHSSYTYFPDKFWGLGNHTDRRKPIPFAYKQFYVFPQLLKRVYSKLYVGISLEYQHVYNFYYNKNDFYDYHKVVGLQGGVIPGAGILMTWDSRDNAFSPSKGEFFEFAATDFENRRRDYDYSNYVFDFRKYVAGTYGKVLAFQFYANLNKGTIPILSLASMGGSMIMRGYYSGRFRDNNLAATQIEYRVPIKKNFGVVGFAGLGQVARTLNEFSAPQLKGAAGGGLRFALKPQEKLNLRIDYGVARHSHGFYLTVAEAF